MADFTATFEAGVNGNSITTAGGEASATAWDDVVNTPKYSNAQAAHGTLSCEISVNDQTCRWTMSSSDHYGRVYLYLTIDNGANYNGIVTFATPGPQPSIFVEASTRKLLCANGANLQAGAQVLPLNQWFRFEYHFVNSTTVGLVEAKLFLTPDSSTPTETITLSSQNTSTSTSEVQFGCRNGTLLGNMYLDDIVANATSYPGPVPGGGPTPGPADDPPFGFSGRGAGW